jgi:hypothetical protein
MRVYLCIPRPPVTLPDGRTIPREGAARLKLRWTTHHPASSHGLGVLLDADNQPFDGHAYRHLRDAAGAWLEAEDLGRVRAALGLRDGERVGRE